MAYVECFDLILSPRPFNLIFFLFLGILPLLNAQKTQDQGSKDILFISDEPLDLELGGDFKSIFANREDEAQYFDCRISEKTADGQKLDFPLKIKTRGHFRRIKSNCSLPPLLLNFQKNETPSRSVFSGQDKIKLVVPCRGEKYVIREYLGYKLYNLLTPLSFRARLVKIKFIPNQEQKDTSIVLGILIEDEDKMAERNAAEIIKTDLIRPQQIDQTNFLQVAIYEYMIGNTDWSVQYRQNIKLLRQKGSSKPIAVPYDFDHSGLVSAPYALPAPELKLASVIQRRYRGYCMTNLESTASEFEIFKTKRDQFILLIDNCPLLDERSVTYCRQYVESFFETIADEKKWKRDFNYPCIESGTGNVVIKGLRE
ncbi:MAG: hypothetical protein IPL46_30205 [Saprospiraceae bacterium]|nr:hypothetical protein [Saprospiraceae bacterium]